MKVYLLALVATIALVALAACDGGNGGDGGNGDGENGGTDATPAATGEATGEPSPSGPPPSPAPEICPEVEGEIIQGMWVELELPEAEYAAGEPIDMTMRMVNCASRELTRHFPTAQRYDFYVTEVGGDEVWRWSSGQEFAQEEGEETFEPSEEVVFEETWDQTNDEGEAVAPGTYEITAESTGCDETLETCGPSSSAIVDITS